MGKKRIWIGSVLAAALIAAFIRLGFSMVPTILTRGDSDVSVTCGEVKPGMAFPEMSEVLHKKNRYSYELFDGSTEYIFYGDGGGCRVIIDPQSGRVTSATFNPPNPNDRKAM
jgi:hypothetical protein